MTYQDLKQERIAQFTVERGLTFALMANQLKQTRGGRIPLWHYFRSIDQGLA